MVGAYVEYRASRNGLIGYVLHENGCWEWAGSRQHDGYGVIRRDKTADMAHRLMYERSKGPVPDGMHLDHLCRNPWCVNPDHLEAVPPRVNILRGVGASAVNAKRIKCKHGHENWSTFMRNGYMVRDCLTCAHDNYLRNRDEKRKRDMLARPWRYAK